MSEGASQLKAIGHYSLIDYLFC